MKIKNLFIIISLFMILLCCVSGISAVSDDIMNDTVSEIDSIDESVSAGNDEQVIGVEDSASVAQENDDEQLREPNRQIHTISDEDSYNQYILPYGLNGSAGDTYNFVSDFTGKTVYIDKDNTTITSAEGVVLTNCGFSINSGVSGVTINGLTIRNTISSYPIYVGPNCSDISITNNNILVNYSSNYQSWLYGIDFNAYDWATNTTYNFNNIAITDNTITMYGNSYVCGIYGSNFINSNVLRNTIYAYSDTTSTLPGNNAVYGIALCDDSTWAVVSRPQNNKISNNNIHVLGQSVYGIEDFGINQNISDNTIRAIAFPTGSAYGIALGILDNSIINNDIIYITAGNLTQCINTDMIHGSNAGIRLHSNSTYGYYCNNVTINDGRIYYNTFINRSYYSGHVQNDEGNTDIIIMGTWDSSYWDSNPYSPIYSNNVPQNVILKSEVNDILCAIDSSMLMASDIIYVDPVNGNDNADGSKSNPVKSIEAALQLVSAGGTIILNEGTYTNGNYGTPIEKSVSIIGVNREKTILLLSSPLMPASYGSANQIYLSNFTIKNHQIMVQGYGATLVSNWINITFEKMTQMSIDFTVSGSYLNIINCSFDECGMIAFGGAGNAYSININSSTFNKMNTIFSNSMKNPVSVNYCSFVDCKNIVQASNNVNVNFNNSYFGMNDNPSTITNVDLDNWVVMTFENTTELHESGDASFIVSFKKVAHADGNYTELEHPELLSFPINEVTYTLINGTEVTHTLKNLEDASTFTITGSGTIRATAAGQTLKITIGKDITLNIEKYDAIGYGGEQDLVFISNYNNITGTMKVTITGPNYSKEETLDIYGGRSFLTLKGLNVGEYTVDVAYSGDDLYYPASNSTTFKVLPVDSDDITLKVYVEDIAVGETANILVFVGPKGATGNVTITIDGNPTTEKLDANGIASFSIKDLSEKNYTVTVKYNGDTNFETASTTAKLKVMPNTIVENLTEQLNQTKTDLANKTEQLNQTKADLANKTAEVAKTQEQVTKLTNDLNTANQKAATASDNADAIIKKIKAASSVKKSKKYTITVTLNKKVKGKFVYVSFNGKVYKAKTNAKGIAKITIKKSALKKLAGKKVKYQVISGNSLKNKKVKIKK